MVVVVKKWTPSQAALHPRDREGEFADKLDVPSWLGAVSDQLIGRATGAKATPAAKKAPAKKATPAKKAAPAVKKATPARKAPAKKAAPLSAVDASGRAVPVPSKEERDRRILGDAEVERRQAAKKAPAKKAAQKAAAPAMTPRAKARADYEAVAQRRPYAHAGAELAELIGKKADNQTIAEHLRAHVHSSNPEFEEADRVADGDAIRDDILMVAALFEAGRSLEGKQAMARLMRAQKLDAVGGAAGRRVEFDPDVHRPVGADPAAGAPVVVVTPGVAFRRGRGDTVRLFDAVVVVAPPAKAAKKAAPTKRAPAKEAAPPPASLDVREFAADLIDPVSDRQELDSVQEQIDAGKSLRQIGRDLAQLAERVRTGTAITYSPRTYIDDPEFEAQKAAKKAAGYARADRLQALAERLQGMRRPAKKAAPRKAPAKALVIPDDAPPMLRELAQRPMADLRRLAKMFGAGGNDQDPVSMAHDIRASRIRAWTVPGDDPANLTAVANADDELRIGLREIDAAKAPAKRAPAKKVAPAKSTPRLRRPGGGTLDENVPLSRDPQGDNMRMHGDSATMNLAQAYARAGRNGSANRMTDLRRRATTPLDDGIHPQQVVDELRAIRAQETDPAFQRQLDQAIEAIDAPMTPIPDLPPNTPPLARQLMEDLHAIPYARKQDGDRTGSGYFRGPSLVDQLAATYWDASRAERPTRKRPDDRVRSITRGQTHEVNEASFRLWELARRLESDESIDVDAGRKRAALVDELSMWEQGKLPAGDAGPKADGDASGWPGSIAEVLTGQDALDATPTEYRSGPKAHFGDYDGATFTVRAGAGSEHALAEYEGVEYERTNNYLRRGPMADSPNMVGHVDDRVREMDAETATRVAEIDKTMAVSPLSHDVEVTRVVKDGRATFGPAWHEGVINDATTDFDEQDREYERWLAGDRPDLTGLTWQESAYVSTSVSDEHSQEFGDRWVRTAREMPDSTGEPVIMTIRVPAGTQAIQLGQLGFTEGPGGRQIMGSAELLLQRGLLMTVVADHGVDDKGFRRLDVEVSTGTPSSLGEARTDLDARLGGLGRRVPADTSPLDRAATARDRGTSVADVAKQLRADAAKMSSREDAETLRLLATDLTKKNVKPPYIDGNGNIDLDAFAEHAGIDLSDVYAPDGATSAGAAPIEEQRPHSYGLERIVRDLRIGKIGRTVAVRRLREEAERAAASPGYAERRSPDLRYRSNMDKATIIQGPLAADKYGRLADALEAAKIPAKSRTGSLGGTRLAEIVPTDESRYTPQDLKEVISHGGERLPEEFHQIGTGTAVALALGTPDQQHRPGLTDAENQALDYYTVGQVADGINKSLRAGRNAHGKVDVKTMGDQQIGVVDLDELRRNLDTAIARSELTADTELWRGTLVKPGDLARLVPGAIYHDAGYMSTTTSEGNARGIIQWRMGQGSAGSRKPVLFKILAPAGTHGAVGHERAREVLLGHGREFRVVRVDDSGKIPVVIMELVPEQTASVRGSDLVDGFDYDGMVAEIPSGRRGESAGFYLGGDPWHARLLTAQGFDGLPATVSREELDQRVADGDIELWRGVKGNSDVSPEDLYEQFRSGTMFPGLGMYGNGTYATPTETAARGYGNGTAVRMALRRDARVISYEDVRKLYAKLVGRSSVGKLADQQTAELARVTPGDTAAIEEILARYDQLRSRQSPRNRVLADLGRFATMLGYDVVYVAGGPRKKSPSGAAANPTPDQEYAEYVILNRTALAAQEAD